MLKSLPSPMKTQKSKLLERRNKAIVRKIPTEAAASWSVPIAEIVTHARGKAA
jgi:hypothetical protein